METHWLNCRHFGMALVQSEDSCKGTNGWKDELGPDQQFAIYP